VSQYGVPAVKEKANGGGAGVVEAGGNTGVVGAGIGPAEDCAISESILERVGVPGKISPSS
jgi:hypothetical protein